MTETPLVESPPADPSVRVPTGRFGKKVYAAVAVAVIVIALVAVVVFVPRGYGDSIPLTLDYQVGEETVYVSTERGVKATIQ